MTGMVHIYCGDGKGKTTAAVGLAIRAAGAGKRVLFVQFLKDGSSGEIKILQQISGIRVMYTHSSSLFLWQMSDEQKEQAKRDYRMLLKDAVAAAGDVDLLVLDEAVSACNYDMIDVQKLAWFLQQKPEHLEIVLTGRNPPEILAERADYITEMKKHRHPFDRGVYAREGIEY